MEKFTRDKGSSERFASTRFDFQDWRLLNFIGFKLCLHAKEAIPYSVSAHPVDQVYCIHRIATAMQGRLLNDIALSLKWVAPLKNWGGGGVKMTQNSNFRSGRSWFTGYHLCFFKWNQGEGGRPWRPRYSACKFFMWMKTQAYTFMFSQLSTKARVCMPNRHTRAFVYQCHDRAS